MPLVSLVIAVYNIEEYIGACIRSAAGQTYSNLEILLIDDGSSDRSGEICDEAAGKDPRIRVIHKENKGISDVRNVGIQEARGIYLMYIDGDDYISPDCVESVLLCARENEADIVVFDYTEVEESTGRKDHWSMDVPRGVVTDAKETPALLVASPSPCNKLYRKAFLEDTGLRYPVGRNYEDLAVTPRFMVNARRVVYLERPPLYYYIIHDGSIMRSRNFKKSFEDRKAAVEDILDYFKSHGLYDEFKDELEYLTFEHAYFVPTKEVLYYDPKSEYRGRFREFVLDIFPRAEKNPYVRMWLSRKDKLILWLMARRLYCVIRLLSRIRKKADLKKKKV